MRITRRTDLAHHGIKRLVLGVVAVMQVTLLAVPAGAAELWDLPLEELGKMRVTSIASGTQTPLDKAAAVATVITEADIIAMGATDLDQVLETVPGLHVGRSDQAYTPKYIIRGITSTYNPQTLVLINGIPVTSLFVGNRGNAWGGMPVKAISRIEVIRGPGSALYGADAFAGVINIITKGKRELEGTRVGARAGSFDTQAAWLKHGGSYGGFDVGLTVEAEQTDGWKETIDQDLQTVFDQGPAPDVSLAPGPGNNQKKMMEARLDIAHEHSRLRAGYQGRHDAGTGPGILQALDPHGRYGSDRYNADYTYALPELTPDWGLEGRVSYYRYTQEVERNFKLLPPGTFGGAYPDGLIGNPEYQEENARFDLSSLYQGFDRHLIRLGAGFYWGDIFEVTESKNFTVTLAPRPGGLEDVSDTPEAFLPEKQRTSRYAYAQDEWKLAPDWSLTTGVRYDHYSDFGDTTNPRLALVWAATAETTAKLLYGRAFRAPSIAELFVTSNPIALGNPGLDPETIDTYELAMSHRASDALLATANVFYYDIEDYITFVPVPGGGGVLRQAQNVGERKGRGLELEADYSPSYNLRLLANYAYQHSEDKQSRADVGEAPQHQVYGRSEWGFLPSWHLDAQLTWVGKQRHAAGDNRPEVDDYTTVDLAVRKLDAVAGLELALSVRNLFDADVREPSPGPTPVVPVPAIPNDFPMAGRSIYAELQYQF